MGSLCSKLSISNLEPKSDRVQVKFRLIRAGKAPFDCCENPRADMVQHRKSDFWCMKWRKQDLCLFDHGYLLIGGTSCCCQCWCFSQFWVCSDFESFIWFSGIFKSSIDFFLLCFCTNLYHICITLSIGYVDNKKYGPISALSFKPARHERS